MRSLLSLCLFFMMMTAVVAQSVPFHRSAFPDQRKELREAKKQKKKGMRLARKGEHRHPEAIILLQAAHNFNPNNSELNLRLGNLLFNSENPHQALPFLHRAWEIDTTIKNQYILMLAHAAHLNHRFKQAVGFYSRYYESLKPRHARRWEDQYHRFVSRSRFADSLVMAPSGALDLEVNNLGNRINSAYPEYGPVFVPQGNRVWFTSRRPGSTGGKTDKANRWFEDIYYLEKLGQIWSDPINAGDPFNTENHESVLAVSPDGSEVYIRRGNPDGNLFVVRADGPQSWRKPRKLHKKLRSKSNDSWITFSPDSTRVWFVSERRGGYGGKDIWMSEQNRRGKWKKPVNAGPEINTPYDEEAVFIAADGKTLFFSSQGHQGMGGFDVFITQFEDTAYTQPVNLGHPINTASNDIHFSWCMNTGNGWMASDRPGGYGGYDVYQVKTIIAIELEEAVEDFDETIEEQIPIEVPEMRQVEEEVEEVEEIEEIEKVEKVEEVEEEVEKVEEVEKEVEEEVEEEIEQEIEEEVE